MQFYLKGIQATYLIQKNLPQLQNGNFSEKNLKLMRLE